MTSLLVLPLALAVILVALVKWRRSIDGEEKKRRFILVSNVIALAMILVLVWSALSVFQRRATAAKERIRVTQ